MTSLLPPLSVTHSLQFAIYAPFHVSTANADYISFHSSRRSRSSSSVKLGVYPNPKKANVIIDRQNVLSHPLHCESAVDARGRCEISINMRLRGFISDRRSFQSSQSSRGSQSSQSSQRSHRNSQRSFCFRSCKRSEDRRRELKTQINEMALRAERFGPDVLIYPTKPPDKSFPFRY